jgi:SAM-dependent methyltransferase
MNDSVPPDPPLFEGNMRTSWAGIEAEADRILRLCARFRPLGPGTRILDVGCGAGWFPAICRARGLDCRGLERKPHLIERAREIGRRYGVAPEIVLGDIETADLGESHYDVVLATSVFEHVRDWRGGLGRIHRALRPGGLLYFYSSNRFSPVSGEYGIPLYGWLPDRWRLALRVRAQGEGVLQGDFDHHQFTPRGLRAFLRSQGWSRILDLSALEPDDLGGPRPWKRALMRFVKRSPLVREAALQFAGGTFFLCVK